MQSQLRSVGNVIMRSTGRPIYLGRVATTIKIVHVHIVRRLGPSLGLLTDNFTAPTALLGRRHLDPAYFGDPNTHYIDFKQLINCIFMLGKIYYKR